MFFAAKLCFEVERVGAVKVDVIVLQVCGPRSSTLPQASPPFPRRSGQGSQLGAGQPMPVGASDSGGLVPRRSLTAMSAA